MDLKLERVGHVAVAYKDLLLVWGGYRESGQVDDQRSKYHDPQEVLLVDPVTNLRMCMNTTGQVPPSNSGACGVIVGDLLYVHGGYFGDPDFEGNTNNLYQLNLKSRIWIRLEPAGFKPLHRDKMLGWEYKRKIYFFCGFGPPPAEGDLYSDYYQYVQDRSHNWFVGRGWNNQLVAYNIDSNEWEWPKTSGRAPSPRAALSGFLCESKVYIFGGRFKRTRMNDLHILDMDSMKWSGNLNADGIQPQGRSWHSFTGISSSAALLYGGLSSEGNVLGDLWLYNMENNTWVEMQLRLNDQRLWHQGVHIDNELLIFGGVRNNISVNSRPVEHAKDVLCIPTAPKSLLRLSLETCVSSGDHSTETLEFVPDHLRHLIEARRNAVK